MALHELPLEPQFLHGFFSRDLEPVIEVQPKDSVRISVPNAGWEMRPHERFEARSPEHYDGHALAGPIAVRGAKAGQTLAVTVDEVEPGDWGVTHGGTAVVGWELANGVGRTLGREVDLELPTYDRSAA